MDPDGNIIFITEDDQGEGMKDPIEDWDLLNLKELQEKKRLKNRQKRQRKELNKQKGRSK